MLGGLNVTLKQSSIPLRAASCRIVRVRWCGGMVVAFNRHQLLINHLSSPYQSICLTSGRDLRHQKAKATIEALRVISTLPPHPTTTQPNTQPPLTPGNVHLILPVINVLSNQLLVDTPDNVTSASRHPPTTSWVLPQSIQNNSLLYSVAILSSWTSSYPDYFLLLHDRKQWIIFLVFNAVF